MPRNHRCLWLAWFVVLLAACAPSTAKLATTTTPVSATRAVTTVPLATATMPPTPTAIPSTVTVPSTSVPLPAEQDLAQLKDQILQQLISDQTVAPDQLLGVSVLPLTTTGALSPLYAAYSTGSILSLLPGGRHVLAFYTFFLRGWATYLRDGSSARAINDIERAAQLDPNEALYAQSVVYLKR